MTIEFRKHKSGRQFARIEGEEVMRILNVCDRTEVKQTKTPYIGQYILEDTDLWFPCTEQEFNTAYQEALRRIKEMKIL